ncbi:MAG: ATP-binding protein [Bacteroidales bacterium]
MRIGIRIKQAAAVASIVALVVVALSLLQLAALSRALVQELDDLAELVSDLAYHRAFQIVQVVPKNTEPYAALRDDAGLRSILESANYPKGLTYAAIVDRSGYAIAHSDPAQVRSLVPPPAGYLEDLLAKNGLAIYWSLRSSGGETLEVRKTLLLDGQQLGTIRVGVSTILLNSDLTKAMSPAFFTALAALAVAIVVSMFLSRLILRPIHVIRGALRRLGQGELGVRLDMPQRDEFGELGSFFNSLSSQLSADRTVLAGEKAKLESVVDLLEDAVAIFSPDGEVLFANPAMRAVLPAEPFGRPIDDLLPASHPFRTLVRETLTSGQSRGPLAATLQQEDQPHQGAGGEDAGSERLVMTHVIKDVDERMVGVMLVARNLDYLSRVQSTINYSRKLVALGRLSAGVAHEVKNPLNAIVIHLELLKQKLSALGASSAASATTASDPAAMHVPRAVNAAFDGDRVTGAAASGALEHVKVITGEIRRLDEVMQGFLKFTRPEDLKLQVIHMRELLDEVVRVVRPEAEQGGVRLEVDCPESVPDVSGDPGMLRQALLNLAINACQAMPHGGVLRLQAAGVRGRRVQLRVEDTGVGISPENLQRIFNLYFTTKPNGSGIGLSMVYRAVQLHDGEIDVTSVPGRGTTFRVLLPQL